MNAPTPDLHQPDDDYQSRSSLAEQWRGECIQQFAILEQAIEELLVDLKKAAKDSRKVKTGQQVGCAFGHLRELTTEKGLFGTKATALSGTLCKLAPDFEWRAHLTHGVLAVWQGRGSKWLLTFAHRPATGDTVRMHALPWTEACAMRDRLGKAAQVFRCQAGSLRASLS